MKLSVYGAPLFSNYVSRTHLCFDIMYKLWLYEVLAHFGIKGIPELGVGTTDVTFRVNLVGQFEVILPKVYL